MLSCLLKVDPAHRITASELLHNAWVTVRMSILLVPVHVTEPLTCCQVTQQESELTHGGAEGLLTVPGFGTELRFLSLCGVII